METTTLGFRELLLELGRMEIPFEVIEKIRVRERVSLPDVKYRIKTLKIMTKMGLYDVLIVVDFEVFERSVKNNEDDDWIVSDDCKGEFRIYKQEELLDNVTIRNINTIFMYIRLLNKGLSLKKINFKLETERKLLELKTQYTIIKTKIRNKEEELDELRKKRTKIREKINLVTSNSLIV